MSWFFGGKKVDPKEQAKEWELKLKNEMRTMDRQVLKIDRESTKIKAEIKKAAKAGELEGAKILAREIVKARKSKERLLITKANINSMKMQLKNQMATMKVAGAMEKSTEMMQTMNALVNDRECAQIMRSLAHEMAQASIIDEIMDEAFEEMEPDGLEEESSEEVEKILMEITGDMMKGVTETPSKQPAIRRPVAETAVATNAAEEQEEEEDDDEMAAMQARIAALRAE